MPRPKSLSKLTWDELVAEEQRLVAEQQKHNKAAEEAPRKHVDAALKVQAELDRITDERARRPNPPGTQEVGT